MYKYIRFFDTITLQDIPVVGGKNASLGELYTNLTKKNVKVPYGFAITADAYREYISKNKVDAVIQEELSKINIQDYESLNEGAGRIRAGIQYGEMPEAIQEEIYEAYTSLNYADGSYSEVAVRSSATAEDLPHASFAGQQDTYLNIRGRRNLVSCCKQVFASLFTDRAISYRAHHQFDHKQVALSIVVQKMVRSDLACSGVMFTIDTESGFDQVIYITAGYGLGENIVQGAINPDEYYAFKPAIKNNRQNPILKKQLGTKQLRMIYTQEHTAGHSTKNVTVHPHEQNEFALQDNEIVLLAQYGLAIEEHYSIMHGKKIAMDIEWAKDGIDGQLYVVQARPETVKSRQSKQFYQKFTLASHGEVLTEGKSVGEKIASGNTRLILSIEDMDQLQQGEILVTDITDPDWEPVLKRAAGIITNRGGRTCHAAIIARELGIPAIVGCNNATSLLQDTTPVTISCAEGDTGRVYKGIIPFSVENFDLSTLSKTKTKLMVNIGNPQIAMQISQLPVDGVGLARLEFIITNSIRVHPKALIEFDSLDEYTKYRIEKITSGYSNPKDFYIEKLTEGISTIAAAFYPRPTIVRLSDFKSNEYASLVGGDRYEPKEENPMLGFRGASRYYSDQFIQCFELECEAIRRARTAVGLENIIPMIPFARTVEECSKVISLMEKFGLKRGKDALEIYLMCELPSNAILADRFLELVDGFSIGSNDLTQLTLGVDRDSGLLRGFDERDEAVKTLVSMAIKSCLKNKKYIGICGQAPSDYPEFTTFLVENNITSISLNPDSVFTMKKLINSLELSKNKQND
ncbi:MAG: phosphoenolpyruvate synthase [Methylacidiphilales bacterium]|nr:phosphoenolpyruvate synthase [Candidatus Methylacidiphilales bacterium]